MNSKPPKPLPKVQKEIFGSLPNGTDVYAYSLINSNGTLVTLLTYGAIIQSIKAVSYTHLTLPTIYSV